MRISLAPCAVLLCGLLAAVPSRAQSPSPSATAATGAETTPMNTPLPEGAETLITCQLTKAPTITETRIFESPKDADSAKGTWHYKLWIPTGYAAAPLKKWPVLFIMSAGGNAGMGVMADHLKAKGYVVVMLVDSKNGPWGPVIGNFLAAHDDVVKRVRIDETKKVATGQSGGARGSSLFVQARPGFVGLVMQAAGPASERSGYDVLGLRNNGKLYVAMTMGDTDQNKDEVERTKAAIGAPARFQVFPFKGGHMWAPKEVIEPALTWVEGKAGI